MVTIFDIATAEERYLIPVIGAKLVEAVRAGNYPILLSDYIAPALALYTREVANTPTAPRSAEGQRRARAMMLRLSNLLDEKSGEYPEYSPECNTLKRCRIDGGHIQVR